MVERTELNFAQSFFFSLVENDRAQPMLLNGETPSGIVRWRFTLAAAGREDRLDLGVQHWDTEAADRFIRRMNQARPNVNVKAERID